MEIHDIDFILIHRNCNEFGQDIETNIVSNLIIPNEKCYLSNDSLQKIVDIIQSEIDTFKKRWGN